jgi:hypothetical protein
MVRRARNSVPEVKEPAAKKRRSRVIKEKGDTIQALNIISYFSTQAFLAFPSFAAFLTPSPASSAFHTLSPGTPMPPEAALPYGFPLQHPATASREEKDKINKKSIKLAREAGVEMAKKTKPKNTTEAY